ncbi:MAG: hypothetical protein OWS74_07475 [Firmicutes bacterium]|nr:hypothetical protein [Bacillota bacterium]
MNNPVNWGSSPRGLGTLISVVVRYPEISSVRYDPDNQMLGVSFVLKRTLDRLTWRAFRSYLTEVLKTYRAVTKQPLKRVRLSRLELEQATALTLERDVATIAVEEIGMAIEVLHERFGSDLAVDSHDIVEEELFLQEESLQANLESLGNGVHGPVVAMREEGRVVIVFND